MNVAIGGLTDAVMKEVNLYREELQGEISEVFDEVASEALTEIKNQSENAGFKNRRYSKGWAKTVKRNKLTGSYQITIYNKKYYRLTHLLEKGHAKVNGGRTRAFPHIAPTQDKMDILIVKRLEEAIQR